MGGGIGEVVTGIETVIRVLETINPSRSAVITVVNHTSQLLWRIGQDNDHGGFATLPADSIPVGGSDSFGVRDAENSFMTGVEGWVKYNAGGMGQCEWRVHWDVPAIGSNSADHELAGAEASRYSADEVWGNGHDKVPFRFTLVGGPKPPQPEPPQPEPPQPEPPQPEPPQPEPPQPEPPQPEPPQPEPPQPEPPQPDFTQPTPTGEPTLRHGDHSVDGWVEYLQQRLTELGYPLNADGKFGDNTHRAVIKFQTDWNIKIDGIVGNQTWAALRDETPREPSTDKRAPHSYVEVGPEARWDDRDTSMFYDVETDRLIFYAINVGNVVIMPGSFRGECQITTESGEIITAYLDIPGESPQADPGEHFVFVLEGVYQHAGPGTHQVQAYQPQELGGDFTSGNFTIEPLVR